MGHHVVVGAGPVGREVAGLLASRGEQVVLASRSGVGEQVPGTRRVAVDAADAGALGAVAEGAEVIYNCLNPTAYHRWVTEWPPMARALLEVAEQTGAVLAVTGNLYPYGRPQGPMVEGMPDRPGETKGRVRARLWEQALERHRAGRVRVVEVRGSDYVGAGVPAAQGHLARVLPAALKGRAVRMVGRVDVPHTWTDVRDMARTLVAAAHHEPAWGRVWHAPSAAPRSQQEALTDVLAAAGRTPVPVRPIPGWVLAASGLVSPALREVRRIDYQFTAPFVMESAATAAELGIVATPWEQVCARTAGVGSASVTGAAG